MLPPFNEDGNLPPGVHSCTWPEFVAFFGWNAHRGNLIAGLLKALQSLRDAGCSTVFLDGSFVTAKESPSDFDGCWEATGVNGRVLDPILLTFDQDRFAQKTKYGGELFPAQFIADRRTGRRYLEFFQQDKDGHAKGVVVINLGGLP